MDQRKLASVSSRNDHKSLLCVLLPLCNVPLPTSHQRMKRWNPSLPPGLWASLGHYLSQWIFNNMLAIEA